MTGPLTYRPSKTLGHGCCHKGTKRPLKAGERLAENSPPKRPWRQQRAIPQASHFIFAYRASTSEGGVALEWWAPASLR